MGTSCQGTLAPGAQCALNLTFAASQAGPVSGSAQLETNAGTVHVALTGEGLRGLTAELSASANSIQPPTGSFETTAVSSARQQTIFVKNTGQTGALAIGAQLSSTANFRLLSALKVRTSADGASYEGSSCGATLSTGALSDCQADAIGGQYPDVALTVQFLPASEGAQQATLSVTHNGTNESPLSLALSGIGEGTPTADLSANTLSWTSAVHPTNVGSSSAATVRLTNNGSTALTLTGPVQVTGSTAFGATSNCPASLPIGGYCDATVTFTPLSTATQTGSVRFQTSAGAPTVALNGYGLEAQGSLAATVSPDFGAVPLAGTSTRAFAFTNTGNKAATGVYVRFSTGTNLSLSSNTCGTQAAPVTVQAGASCGFSVVWTAATSAALSDTVSAYGTFTSSTASVNLTGSLTAANYTTATTNGWDLASPLVRHTYANAALLCSQSINGKSGWRMATQAEFETLRTAANIAGAGWPATAADYYWTSTPYIAGTHVVRLAVSSGSYAADTDYHYPTCVRTFAAGALAAQTDSNFGAVTVTTSNEKTFTFTSGPVALTGVSPAVSGSADLNIKSTTCSSSLAANSSCLIVVSYAPNVVSNLSNAKLTVASSAENTPATANLSGAGIADTSVVSLLHFEGVNGATALGDAVTGSNWTNTGLTLTTANKQFGTSAANFNGSAYAVSTQNVALGSNAFTAEAWFYPTRVATYEYLFGQLIPNNNNTWSVGLYNGKPGVGAWNAVSWNLNATTSATLNAWNHIALVRSGTELRLYMNGALVASTSSGVPTFATNKVSVGIAGPTWGQAPFLGVIDELRVSNGTARYSGSTYTVPSAAFALP